MKRIILLLFVIIFGVASASFAQSIRHGKVLKKDQGKRIIAVDIGIADGVTKGTAFVLRDDEGREIGCIIATDVKDRLFWTDLVQIGIYNEVKIGMRADELGAGCKIEGPILAYVPGGFFGMGDIKQDNETPPHSKHLKAFYIDKYEVTNKEYKKFVDETKYRIPYVDSKEAKPYNWQDNKYPKGKANYPVVLVNAIDAQKYCEFFGKRLPTEAEWEKAARGSGNRIWPWGNAWDKTKLSNKEDGHTSSVIIGSHPDDLSPYDAVDMGGNVSEWTSSPYLPYQNNQLNDKNYSVGKRVVRGGSWQKGKNEARTSARQFASPDTKSVSIGFRCVKEIK